MNEGEEFVTKSDYDIDDVCCNYNNALDIEFEDLDDSDGFMEEDMEKLLDYDHDTMSTIQKQKHKRNFNESENDSEELKSGCKIDEESGTNRKKYSAFKFQKNMANYKYGLGTYFSTKFYFKEEITTYTIQSSVNLKLMKNNTQMIMVRCKDRCEWNLYYAKQWTFTHVVELVMLR